MTYHYPRELAEALLTLGLAPTSATPPAFARGAIDELYKYELRRLRDRVRVGDVGREQFLEHVIALRKRYWMLTLPLAAWEKICSEVVS